MAVARAAPPLINSANRVEQTSFALTLNLHSPFRGSR